MRSESSVANFDMIDQTPTPTPRIRNLVAAFAAIAIAAALVLGWLTPAPETSLAAQAEASVPLEVARENGKPTLVEFYANWCTSCQAMAADLGKLKADYRDRVNFVMLNVDNSKWIPEMLAYNVDGIPHFAFVDAGGETVAEAIGEIPRAVLEADLDALIASRPLPYNAAAGPTSNVAPSPLSPSSTADDPRSHSS